MANPLRAITVYPTIASAQSSPGPSVPHHVTFLDRPVLFRFAIGDTTTDDAWTALDISGGVDGRYLDVPENDLGASLAGGTETITVGGKRRRMLTTGTLSGNSTGTLSTTGAREGHWIELSLQDDAAYTYAVVNGGPGAGTLATKASGEKRLVKARFNGTNWVLWDSHAIT